MNFIFTEDGTGAMTPSIPADLQARLRGAFTWSGACCITVAKTSTCSRLTIAVNGGEHGGVLQLDQANFEQITNAVKDGAKDRRQAVLDLQAGARRWRAIKHWNGCIARHRRTALADAEPWVRRRLGSLEKSNPSADEAFMQRLKSRARLTEKECEQLFAQPRRNGL